MKIFIYLVLVFYFLIAAVSCAKVVKDDFHVLSDSLYVTNGTPSKDASAIVQADSTTQGLLAPRMTEAQRDAISTPASGLQIYNTDTDKIDYYNGTSWQQTSESFTYESYESEITTTQAAPSSDTWGDAEATPTEITLTAGTWEIGFSGSLYTHFLLNASANACRMRIYNITDAVSVDGSVRLIRGYNNSGRNIAFGVHSQVEIVLVGTKDFKLQVAQENTNTNQACSIVPNSYIGGFTNPDGENIFYARRLQE